MHMKKKETSMWYLEKEHLMGKHGNINFGNFFPRIFNTSLGKYLKKNKIRKTIRQPENKNSCPFRVHWNLWRLFLDI